MVSARFARGAVVALTVCGFSGIGSAWGAGIGDFLAGSYTDPQGHRIPYRLHVPDGYDPAESYPLILFLHPGGQQGTDNQQQIYCARPIVDQMKRDPNRSALVLAPQCLPNQSWSPNGPWASGPALSMALAIGAMQQVAGQYRVDTDRVIVTGHSMGGFGTWDAICRYPDLFAAAVPLAGGGDPAEAYRAVGKPIWAFHAADDPVVSVEWSRAMVQAVTDAGGQPRYTELPSGGHNIWFGTYSNPEVMDWMLAQSLPEPGSLALLMAGAVALLGRSRKKAAQGAR